MTLWEDATITSVYVQNRSPHRVFGNKTLEEAFTGVNLDVSHLRIFGFSVYIHVPKEKRSKLEPQERRKLLLDIVRHQRLIKCTSLFRDKLRSVEMSLLMRRYPSRDLGILIWISMVRI